MSIILKKSENETFMKTAIEKLNVNKTSGLIRGHFLYVRTTNENTFCRSERVAYNKNGHPSRTFWQYYVSFAGFLATTRFAKLTP